MDKIFNRINELLKIRSIVTLGFLVLVFILSINDKISAEIIMSMFGTIIGFYFGTKNNKNNTENDDN